MRSPGGTIILSDVESDRLVEVDTFTCAHCQTIVRVPPMTDPASLGGLCGGCSGLICPKCLGKGCVPIEERIRQIEHRYDVRRSYGLGE